MLRSISILALLGCQALCGLAQNTQKLIGKSYERFNRIRGFERYKPVMAYPVFDEMVCCRYRDTLTYEELMIFEKTRLVNGEEAHIIADVLKIEGTGRYRILSVGANKFAAYSDKNIIIAIEEVAEDGSYVLPPRSRIIYSAYTLEHKGHKFVSVPLKGLYRVGEAYFMERTTRY